MFWYSVAKRAGLPSPWAHGLPLAGANRASPSPRISWKTFTGSVRKNTTALASIATGQALAMLWPVRRTFHFSAPLAASTAKAQMPSLPQ